MKLCFHYEEFDRDVSSGTEHALQQWYELARCFGVTEVAIINLSGETLPTIDSNMLVREFDSLLEFESGTCGEKTFVEQGGEYHFGTYGKRFGDWIVIGGVSGLPQADVFIPTNGSLYPREAAAIVLAEACA